MRFWWVLAAALFAAACHEPGKIHTVRATAIFDRSEVELLEAHDRAAATFLCPRELRRQAEVATPAKAPRVEREMPAKHGRRDDLALDRRQQDERGGYSEGLTKRGERHKTDAQKRNSHAGGSDIRQIIQHHGREN